MMELLLGAIASLATICLVFPLLWVQAYAMTALKMDSSKSSLLRYVVTSIELPMLLAIMMPLLAGKLVILHYNLDELTAVTSWIVSIVTLPVLVFYLYVIRGEKKPTP